MTEEGSYLHIKVRSRLFQETDVARQKIFAIGGHEDGIVAFGSMVEEAGTILLDQLSLCGPTTS